MSNNSELLNRRMKAVPRGVASATAVHADRALNAELWDVDGKRYVDFAGGIAVLNTGHRHPRILAAVQAQLDRFTHTAFQVAPYESYIALCERLNALAPFSGEARTLLVTTGAEATENAAKIARAATGRAAIIAFTGGFHGRTMFASAMTGKVSPYKRQFGPMAGEVYHVPFPTGQDGLTVEQSIAAIHRLFQGDVPPDHVAAIIIEPVQGEGGFHVAPPAFFAALRALCDDHGILLIADEVQSGFARTGTMFAIEQSGVEPDLVCIAKSLAGGFPLSGVIGRASVMDVVEPGGLGGTYGGSPVSCAAALAVLDIIADEQLIPRSRAIGMLLKSRFEALAAAGAPLANVRGLGAMVAFDALDQDGVPSGASAKALCAAALERGLILLTCGSRGDAVRILVPLTASDAIIEEGLAIIAELLPATSVKSAA